MGRTIEELIMEMFSNLFVGAFEKPSLIFTQSDRRKGGAFSRKLRNSANGMITSLSKPIYRKAFLYGCSTFYYNLNDANEWLIIGLGETAGAKTKIDNFYIQKGDATGVEIPSDIIKHIKTTQNSDVIFVHNHPPKPLRLLKNIILSDAPIASTQDRILAWRNKLEVVFGLLGKRRFYLIENNYVKEFYFPSLESIMSFFDRGAGSTEEKIKNFGEQIIRRVFK